MSAAVLDLGGLKPGFRDPTAESQAIFRALMDAMSRPGKPANLAAAPEPPAGVSRAAAAVVLTLADMDAPLWLDPALRGGEAETWFRFHTGAPIVAAPADASFALVTAAPNDIDLGAFNQGDAKYPDRAATVIVDIASLTGAAPLTLRGPGIKEFATIAPAGLDAAFWRRRQDCVSRFQFGIDLFVTAGDHLLALPRTTRVALHGE